MIPARKRHDIAGRTVLITGPARGIGAESARQLARKGARLALVGIEPDLLERLAAELDTDTEWFEADVRRPEKINSAVHRAADRFGGIDIVIANAGVCPMGSVEAMDTETFEDIVSVNLHGVWHTMRASLPYVSEHSGYLFCISSLTAVIQTPLIAAYAASKAGVEALANTLRLELAGRDVGVGVAYFGVVETDLGRGALGHPAAQRMARIPPRFATRPVPVERAARGIVRAIELRSRRVCVPWWTRAPVVFPAPFEAATAALLTHTGAAAEACRIADGPGAGRDPGSPGSRAGSAPTREV